MRGFLASLLPYAVNLPQVVFWGGAIWMAIWGSALDFQRWGSVGVAMSLVGFGLARMLARYVRSAEERREAAEDISAGKLILALVGTVQWGYGDLAHDWAHGLAEGA
jgi:uncharacterized membrane protein YjfL (UPF0719 family)